MQNRELGTELGYKGYTTTHLTPEDIDNEFMRRFNLVSRRIAETKGTLESIDMIMALFGLSRWNGDYSVEEEYKTVTPKEIARWDEDSLSMVRLKGDGASFVYNDDDDESNKIELTNHKKYDMPRYYDDDPYSGLPLRNVYIGNDLFLVPYCDHDKFYDGEFCFQFRGGWGKHGENDFEHLETMNYLRVVGTLSDLFTLPRVLRTNEIVYVVDMTSYCKIFGVDGCPPSSHFMLCRDTDSSTSPSGWEIVDENHADYQRALYLDSINSNNRGNNPHVGFGEYDMGNEYWAYLKNPFRYAMETKHLYDLTGYDTVMSDGIEAASFDNDDLWSTVRVIHDDSDNESSYEYSADKCKYRALNDIYPDSFFSDAATERWKAEKEASAEDSEMPNGYIENSKLLVIKNGDNAFVTSDEYKEYFMSVILHYLLQVIPSTAILRIEGFD